MQTGSLNEQIIIQRATRATTPLGDKKAFTSLAPVFGNVRFISDRERFSGGTVMAKQIARITIRNLGNEVSPHDRVIVGGTTYNITSVKPINNRRFIELLVEHVR